jgi:biotin carboxyl carrier protein
MKLELVVNGEKHEVTVLEDKVRMGEREYDFRVEKRGDEYLVCADSEEFSIRQKGARVSINNEPHAIDAKMLGTTSDIAVESRPVTETAIAGEIKPPMTGKVVSVMVKEGDEVAKGALLLVLEAMKMQNEILSTKKGRIKKVLVSAGQVVNSDDTVLIIE